MEVIMSLKGVSKIYVMGKEKIPALRNVDLDIQQGEICCLLGPSGSGKSTLLNMMAGLEKPTKGTIRFKNHQIENMNENNLAWFRRKYIGFIFQSYNLIPTLTAMENITLPLLFKGMPKGRRNKLGREMLKAIGLSDRWKHKPTEMSGGQQQRVSIARAFINKPKVIFADEPTGNLDTHTAESMMHLMISMCVKNKQTLVIVTHNTELASYAGKIVHIRDGSIETVEMNDNTQILQQLMDRESIMKEVPKVLEEESEKKEDEAVKTS